MNTHTLMLQAENCKGAMNEFQTDNHTNDRPRDCPRATPFYAHTHTRTGAEGGYASIKRTLILLVKNWLGREEQKQFMSSLCNATRPNLLRKLENDFSLLFLFGISAGKIGEKRGSSQEKFSRFCTMNCRIHLANPSRKFPFI